MIDYLRSFTVGSSLVATAAPLVGLLIASHDKSADVVDWRVVFLIFPIVFGVANIITLGLLRRTSRLGFAAVGAGLGVALSMAGTFLFHIPELVYGLNGASRFLALVLGPLFYAAVWALVLFPLDRAFGLLTPQDRR